jgi:hypothetical protein
LSRDYAEGNSSDEQSPLLAAAAGQVADGDEIQLRALTPLTDEWIHGKKNFRNGWYMFFLTLGGLG